MPEKKFKLKKFNIKKPVKTVDYVDIPNDPNYNEEDEDTRNENFKRFILYALDAICERIDFLEEEIMELRDNKKQIIYVIRGK